VALTIPTASLHCLFSPPEQDDLVPKGGISESRKDRGLIWKRWHISVCRGMDIAV